MASRSSGIHLIPHSKRSFRRGRPPSCRARLKRSKPIAIVTFLSLWPKAHGRGRRSLVETTMGRYKSIIGDRLHARLDDAQPVELAIGIKVLNHMTNIAKLASVEVG